MLPWLDMVPKSVLGAPGGDVGLEPPELVPPPLRPCSWRQQIDSGTASHSNSTCLLASITIQS